MVPRAQGSNKWSGNKQHTQKMANAAVVQSHSDDANPEVTFTAQQLEHLLKFMPGASMQRGSDTRGNLKWDSLVWFLVICLSLILTLGLLILELVII